MFHPPNLQVGCFGLRRRDRIFNLRASPLLTGHSPSSHLFSSCLIPRLLLPFFGDLAPRLPSAIRQISRSSSKLRHAFPHRTRSCPSLSSARPRQSTAPSCAFSSAETVLAIVAQELNRNNICFSTIHEQEVDLNHSVRILAILC